MLFQKTQVPYKLGFTPLGGPSGLLTTFLRRWGLLNQLLFFKPLLKCIFTGLVSWSWSLHLSYNSAEQDIQVDFYCTAREWSMTKQCQRYTFQHQPAAEHSVSCSPGPLGGFDNVMNCCCGTEWKENMSQVSWIITKGFIEQVKKFTWVSKKIWEMNPMSECV